MFALPWLITGRTSDVPCQPSDGGGGNDALSPNTVYHPREIPSEKFVYLRSYFAPLVCVTKAFGESENNNSVTSLEVSSIASSNSTSSRARLTRLLGSRLITLMAPGFVRHPGG